MPWKKIFKHQRPNFALVYLPEKFHWSKWELLTCIWRQITIQRVVETSGKMYIFSFCNFSAQQQNKKIAVTTLNTKVSSIFFEQLCYTFIKKFYKKGNIKKQECSYCNEVLSLEKASISGNRAKLAFKVNETDSCSLLYVQYFLRCSVKPGG